VFKAAHRVTLVVRHRVDREGLQMAEKLLLAGKAVLQVLDPGMNQDKVPMLGQLKRNRKLGASLTKVSGGRP
jgi:hypothetical protein